ncbi:flavodoxin family protein [Salininema proteolyticum]|uniref:Flavodoxin family protein n=1 Tax=Salininema proteolyticum TaxID=1607685 RepID=A0ABV8TX58_9ACTN
MADANRKFVFLLGSGRRGGNTEILAEEAAAQLPSDVEQEWIRLLDHNLPPFEDKSEGEPPALPEGTERKLLDATLSATDLVVASPLYWYGVTSHTQAYLEYWDKWFLVPGLEFTERIKGRNLWGVTAMGVKDHTHAEPLREKLRLTADFTEMNWKGLLLGTAGASGKIRERVEPMARAKEFFAETS